MYLFALGAACHTVRNIRLGGGGGGMPQNLGTNVRGYITPQMGGWRVKYWTQRGKILLSAGKQLVSTGRGAAVCMRGQQKDGSVYGI